MPLLLSIYLLSLLAFLVHFIVIKKRERTKKRLIELALLYQLVFSIGLGCLISFFEISTLSSLIEPSQLEYFNISSQQLMPANLAFGILGLLSIKFRGHFWTATILGYSLSTTYGTLFLLQRSAFNLSQLPSFIIPLVVLTLLTFHLKLRKEHLEANLKSHA